MSSNRRPESSSGKRPASSVPLESSSLGKNPRRPLSLNSAFGLPAFNRSAGYASELPGFNRSLPTNDYSDLMQNRPSNSTNESESENLEQMEEETQDLCSIDKKNLTWNNDMDEYLIDSLLEQMVKGEKNGGSFSTTAYREVAQDVSGRFGVHCVTSHIQNRLKTIKKNFGVAHDMLRSCSGFGFNNSTQRMEAKSEVWDAYIQAKPKASMYRHAPVKNFEKLCELFGNDRATGRRAAGPKQRQLNWAKRKNSTDSGLVDSDSLAHGNGVDIPVDVSEFGEDQLNNDESSSIGILPSTTFKLPNESKKRKSRLTDIISEEFGSIRAGLDAVAAALERGSSRNYDDRKLFDEVEKLIGLSDISKMKVYQSLGYDVDGARAFLACPTERRELWLRVRFGDHLFNDQ